MHAADPEAQAGLLEAGIAGQLRETEGDFLAVVLNAGAAAKIDYYLTHSVTYRVRLRPDGSLDGDVDVALFNDAPTSGVVEYIIGPNVDGLQAGESRLNVSTFGPGTAELRDFGRSRGSQAVQSEQELGHRVLDRK